MKFTIAVLTHVPLSSCPLLDSSFIFLGENSHLLKLSVMSRRQFNQGIPSFVLLLIVIFASFALLKNSSHAVKTDTTSYYDESYHKIRGSKQNYGNQFFESATSAYPVDTYPRWLDAGTGNCGVLRKLLDAGYDAYGTDLSVVSLEQACPDLVKAGKAQAVPLQRLPFPDGHFDVVFSSDVLEHVPEADVQKSVSELVRVSRTGVLFLSISLRLSNYDLGKPEPVSHVTVRPRTWWEARFAAHGCVRDDLLVSKLQAKMPECISIELAEKMRRAQQGHEWWRDGEREPWFFIFKCSPISERKAPPNIRSLLGVNEK